MRHTVSIQLLLFFLQLTTHYTARAKENQNQNQNHEATQAIKHDAKAGRRNPVGPKLTVFVENPKAPSIPSQIHQLPLQGAAPLIHPRRNPNRLHILHPPAHPLSPGPTTRAPPFPRANS